MSFIAIAFIVVAVIAGTIAVILLELRRLIQDQPLVKRLLDGQRLLGEILPATARTSPTVALTTEESNVLRNAMQLLLPAGWASGESDKAIDEIYRFLNDESIALPDLNIEIGPLLEALDGKPGREAIGSIVDTLPNCPGRSRTPPPPGLLGLPSCVPVEMSRRQMVRQVQKSISKQLTKYLRRTGTGTSLGVEELEAVLPAQQESGEPVDLVGGMLDLRRGVKQVRRFGLVAGIVTLVALGLAIEFSGLGGWGLATVAGWPLAVTGVAVLIITLVLIWRMRSQFRQVPAAVQQWLGTVFTLIQRRLLIWSAALVVLGAILLLVGRSA